MTAEAGRHRLVDQRREELPAIHRPHHRDGAAAARNEAGVDDLPVFIDLDRHRNRPEVREGLDVKDHLRAVDHAEQLFAELVPKGDHRVRGVLDVAGADLARRFLGGALDHGIGEEHERHFQGADQQQHEGRRHQRELDHRRAVLVAQQRPEGGVQPDAGRHHAGAQGARGGRQAGSPHLLDHSKQKHRIPFSGGSRCGFRPTSPDPPEWRFDVVRFNKALSATALSGRLGASAASTGRVAKNGTCLKLIICYISMNYAPRPT